MANEILFGLVIIALIGYGGYQAYLGLVKREVNFPLRSWMLGGILRHIRIGDKKLTGGKAIAAGIYWALVTLILVGIVIVILLGQ